jgi:HSP20 family protein
MASFFEKLKKGMGVEEEAVEETLEEEELVEEKPVKKKPSKPEKPKVKKPKKLEIKTASIETEEETKPEPEEEKPEEEKKVEPASAEATADKEEWFEPEGQLAIDVYQTEDELIIQSAIAGVKSENLDISLEKDIITIKGSREKPFEEKGDYFTQECYWGPFSREIILPVEVDPSRVSAELKEGILTIRIPKIVRERKKKISVKIV